MTDRLSADTDAGRGPELFQAVQPKLPSSVDDRMVFMFRRAEIDKFVRVVGNAFLAHDRKADDGAAGSADGKAIRLDRVVEVIGSLAPAAAIHVFDHHRWIPRYMFSEEWQHRSDAKIACSTRRRGGDERYRLTRVKVVLGIRERRNQKTQHADHNDGFRFEKNFSFFHCSSPPWFTERSPVPI